MDFSNFDSSVISDNLNRLDRDIMRLQDYTGVDHDDLRVQILEGKRNVCSLILEGADSDLIHSQIDNLLELGCAGAVDKFIKKKKWS